MVLRELTLYSIPLRIVAAIIISGVIGMERGLKNRAAGFRTYMLVCIGSCIIMMINQYVFQAMGTGDPTRMAAQVISGIGFLGAGSIIVTSHNQIKGLTTAAGIWTTASVGLAIGAGMYTVGICATIIMIVFQLMLHKYLTKLENTSNEFTVVLNDNPESVKEFREMLKSMNIKLETCKMERNNDSTITLDITIKKSRTTSMDEIMLLAEQNENVLSVEI